MNDTDKREKLIADIAHEAAYQVRQGIFPEAVEEIREAICARKYNLDSILHALKEVKRKKPDIPKKYFWRIIYVQSGNYNFTNHQKTHEEIKEQDRKKAPELAKNIFKRLS